MPALWDEGLKRLLRASPQDFISWLAPGATYQKMLLTELYRKLDSHRNVIADSMCLCRLHDQDVIVHIEFQSEGDRQMAMRLLEYNVLADREYSCPVLSCVIYVRRDYGIAASPLTRRLPDGSLVYQFHFLTISLWEHSAQELLEGNLPGLLALLPLTRDGKDPAVIDEMIVRLQAHDNYEMLSLSYLFSALTWTREEEREWIQRRFAMLRDELQESWAYQEILHLCRGRRTLLVVASTCLLHGSKLILRRMAARGVLSLARGVARRPTAGEARAGRRPAPLVCASL